MPTLTIDKRLDKVLMHSHVSTDITDLSTGYVNISGDTMTGVLNFVNTDAQGQALITPINSAVTTINWARINKTGSNLTDISTRSHTSLTDIGTNTHAQIDTFISTTVPNTYLPLAGGTMTGLLTLDDLGENFTDAVSLPTATAGLRGKVLLIYGTDLASWNSNSSDWDSTTTNWDSTFPTADTLYLCQYDSITTNYAWSALNPSSDYPTAVHTSTDVSAFTASKLGSTTPTHTNLEGKQESEVVAVQTKIGTGSSTPSAGKVLRATGTGTSGWAAADLTTDVTGMLPVANGGTGANTLTGVLIGNGTSAVTVVTAPSGTIVGTTDTQTLTNKRITKRVTSITSNANPTVNTDNCDVVDITAQAEAIASMTTNLSGTPTNKQTLIYEIKDDGNAWGITWGASFTPGGVALPTTTVVSKILTVGFMYSTANALNKWRCIASSQEV